MARFEERDATQTQILEHDNDKNAKRVLTFSPLVPEDYDQIQLSYVDPAANGPLLEFVTYRKNNNIVAVLELLYDVNNNLIDVKRI